MCACVCIHTLPTARTTTAPPTEPSSDMQLYIYIERERERDADT